MGTTTDPEQATAVAGSICDALRSLADAEYGIRRPRTAGIRAHPGTHHPAHVRRATAADRGDRHPPPRRRARLPRHRRVAPGPLADLRARRDHPGDHRPRGPAATTVE